MIIHAKFHPPNLVPKTIPPFGHRICSSSSISLASRSSAAVTRITSTPCLMWEPKVSWSCDSFRKRSWIPSMPGIHVVIHVGTHSHPSKSWWLCIYVCMYGCMHVRTYVRTYVRMYVCLFVCLIVCLFVFVCLFVCLYVCMFVCLYVCMYVCMYACMYACMHLCIYASMHACMCVRTYTEICLNDPSLKGFDALNDGLTIPNHILWGSTKSHEYIYIYIIIYNYIYMHVYHEYIEHINVLESSSRSQLGMEKLKTNATR